MNPPWPFLTFKGQLPLGYLTTRDLYARFNYRPPPWFYRRLKKLNILQMPQNFNIFTKPIILFGQIWVQICNYIAIWTLNQETIREISSFNHFLHIRLIICCRKKFLKEKIIVRTHKLYSAIIISYKKIAIFAIAAKLIGIRI